MQYQLYKDTAGQWRWRLKAGNGKFIANGGESYHNRQDCIDAAYLVIDTNRQTPFVEV